MLTKSDQGNIPLTFADDTYTTNKYEDLNFDSHSLWGIAASDFEVHLLPLPLSLSPLAHTYEPILLICYIFQVVAHDAPTPLTYDCVRNNLPPSSCGAATTVCPFTPFILFTPFSISLLGPHLLSTSSPHCILLPCRLDLVQGHLLRSRRPLLGRRHIVPRCQRSMERQSQVSLLPSLPSPLSLALPLSPIPFSPPLLLSSSPLLSF